MLSLRDICVNYSYKKVLKGISIDFQPGKIYSLLGENGAGKSTLAHVICADIKASSGQIFLDGQELKCHSPKEAIAHGLVCVHQRPLLAPSISIKDNLRIGIPKKNLGNIEKLVNFWLPDHRLSSLVQNLSQEDCFYVSLVGALLKNPRLLIIDEPPAIPLEKLRSLTNQGLSIIMITHNLKEALEKSDEIILLQEGLIIEQKAADQFSEESISQKLYGISKEVQLPSSIEIKKVDEESLKQKLGEIAIIPADKTFKASNPNLTIQQMLTAFNPCGKEKEIKAQALELLKKAGVNIKLKEKVSALSGGMLQKLILERALAQNPKALYLFKPTQGLDVQATEILYERLDKLAKDGTSVIFAENTSGEEK
ncbi:MAG: ATP-binding cassette domain-containing protein [Treponema sp.]|nr:ATP-binding cassette domain-containing protein [Treponema sp.]